MQYCCISRYNNIAFKYFLDLEKCSTQHCCESRYNSIALKYFHVLEKCSSNTVVSQDTTVLH